MSHTQFATTSQAGLNWQHPALRLFSKAKRYGVWNPGEIDFSKDKADYAALSDLEKTVLQHLTSLFVAGEESVVFDLLPLMMVIAKEGRIEEEMFLTSFLWEEAKHTEFFDRVLREVFVVEEDLHAFHGPSYQQIFYQSLPTAMNALLKDSSPLAVAKASVTYNMIVEGVLAETGYHSYYEMLEQADLMPGLREGIGKLKQDESRHIAYGVFLLSRLVAEEPELWEAIEAQMNMLLPVALGVINETLGAYENLPFGLRADAFIGFAMGQFSKRVTRIERAKEQSLAEVLGDADLG